MTAAPVVEPREYSVVVIGTSSGGLAALERLLSGLPDDFALPIAIAQHRARESDDALARVLQARTKLRVHDADDGEPLEAGGVYLAPSDYHMLIDEGRIALSIDEPVAYARPSIDALFESAADTYGAGVVGVLLTGANHDGARGLSRVKERGGFALVQDPTTAESPTMPAAALARVVVDGVMPIERMSRTLVELARRT
jgi:two-component system chemotaxis response regulator CheB